MNYFICGHKRIIMNYIETMSNERGDVNGEMAERKEGRILKQETSNK